MLKLIVFDFDGTLVNTKDIAEEQFAEVLTKFNLPVPTKKQLTPLYGLKISDWFVRTFPKLEEEKVKELLSYHRELRPRYTDRIKIDPDLVNFLQSVAKKYRLALFTSRSRESLDILNTKHKLYDLFEMVVDREHVQNHKPHPEGLLKILSELKVKPEQTIYIGDTEYDIAAAKAAGVKAVLVHPDRNHGLAPDYHISSISDLEKLLTTI